MKKIHLVYSIPPVKKSFRLLNKISLLIIRKPLYRYFPNIVLKWPNPIYAPFSITKNLIETLSKNYSIRVYSLFEKCNVKIKKDEIFIGHPWPDFTTYKEGNNKWSGYDKNQITNKVIQKYPNDKRIFVLSPFNHSFEQCGWLLDLSDKFKTFLAISGDYWIQNLEKSRFDKKFKNIFQIPMAINSQSYPKLKFEFNPKGKRRFLFIGRVSKEKNIEMLEEIAKNVPAFEGGYIGKNEIKGWNKISDFASLTKDFISEVAKNYDFFINVSTFDAQVTTVLEAMCWGFPVLCTPQSGYEEECIIKMSIDDLAFNIEQIKKLQEMDATELKQISNMAIDLVNKKFSWSEFNNKVSDAIFSELK